MTHQIVDETKIHYGFIIEHLEKERWKNTKLGKVQSVSNFLNFTNLIRKPMTKNFIKTVEPNSIDYRVDDLFR